MNSLKKLLSLIKQEKTGTVPLVAGHGNNSDPDGATLIDFGHGDRWTIRDAFEGTQIFGATGSGKTSGSGQAIAEAFLKAGFGGLVLTAKPTEFKEWRWFMKRAGRDPDTDLIEFSPTNRTCFNFLEYERNNGSDGLGIVENIVALLYTILEAEDKADGGRESEPIWKKAPRELISNTVELLMLAGKPLTMRNIHKVIASAPQMPGQFDDAEWQESSFLIECCRAAVENTSEDTPAREDYDMVCEYWANKYPSLAPETRSSILIIFSSAANRLMKSPLRELFGADTGQSITPDDTFKGKVVVVNMPVQTFKEVGIMAQVLFKYCWQRATLRRDAENQKPVFLWADESQFFVNSYDAHFQTTARASRAATVYLTQNINNYYERMPPDKGRAATDSLLGNFQTKVIHQNGDAVTNQWAAELIGRDWMTKNDVAIGTSSGRNAAWEGVKRPDAGTQFNLTRQRIIEYQVQPVKFTQLKKGGLANSLEVEAIVFQGGRMWSHGKNFAKITFRQKPKN